MYTTNAVLIHLIKEKPMEKKTSKLSTSIQDKRLEIHYDEKVINTFKGDVKVKLKGKINCPVLNCKITPLVCSKLMETTDWPRDICPQICSNFRCYISKVIAKHKDRRKR